jgi:hypothetical protein
VKTISRQPLLTAANCGLLQAAIVDNLGDLEIPFVICKITRIYFICFLLFQCAYKLYARSEVVSAEWCGKAEESEEQESVRELSVRFRFETPPPRVFCNFVYC